ncbi:MAG: hypothetical protein HC841_06555 [Verrucomicrobiae bacterium]|nr:hypothetical protein [Verrucomicrobiae bacterium]
MAHFSPVSFEQIKREITQLTPREQAELIAFTLQLRHASDPVYQREVTDRLNDRDSSRWLTVDEVERRLTEG